MSDDVFEFDLQPKEVSYTIAKEPYVLTEASESAWAKYQDLMAKGTRFDADGKPSQAGDHSGSANSVLVANCLFKVIERGGREHRQPVTLAEVQKWPARITQPLIRKIMEISELNKKDTAESVEKEIGKLQDKLARLREAEPGGNGHKSAEELAKNEQSAMTGISV